MKELTYRLESEAATASIYRGLADYPIFRLRYSVPRGWELAWTDPDEVITLGEIQQLLIIWHNLPAYAELLAHKEAAEQLGRHSAFSEAALLVR